MNKIVMTIKKPDFKIENLSSSLYKIENRVKKAFNLNSNMVYIFYLINFFTILFNY